MIKYRNYEIPIENTNFIDDVVIINIKETNEIIVIPLDGANSDELEIINQIKEDVSNRPTPKIDVATLNTTRITELKQLLADSDYVVIKIAEGCATIEEYSDIIAQRQSWRQEINSLMAN